MTTRPTRIAQTSKEAQKSYKKNGPRIPERERRQLERLAELDNRAAKAREQEERRKGLKKKREEKEKKGKEVRKQLGVGLATQVCGYSHTQKRLKTGMEAFLGLKKKEAIDKTIKEEEEVKLKEKLEAIVEDMEKEPWDDSEGDDAMVDLPMVEATEDVAGELPMVDATIVLEGDHWVDDDSDDGSLLQAQDPPALDTRIELEGDHWIDDDLDDGSLLEAHDLVMSDPINEPLETPQVQVLPPLPAPTTIVTKPAVCKGSSPQRTPEDTRSDKCNDEYVFSRLHGPINKAIEDSLNLLPEPLIELLSQDASMRESWNPAPSLLHKLNPTGLPPHRLRLKIGCIVSLLRDLNKSSQLSKSSHLRVLRIENDWLECLVVDGQLEGTKAFLSRVAFPAKYRNEDRFAFQRKQFPIRISTKHAHLMQSRVAQSSAFKIPSVTGQVPRPLSSFKKPLVPVPKPKPPSDLNPSFKQPGLPLSRATKSPAPLTLTTKSDFPSVLMDGWDDFLDSATQIARDLSSDDSTPAPQHKPTTVINDLIPLSTQDLDFDMDDLEDVVQPAYKPSNANQHVKAATTSKPRKATYVSPPNPLGRILGHKTYPKPSMAPSPRPPQVSSNQKVSPAVMPTKPLMPPPSRPPTQHVKPKSTHNSTPIPAPSAKRSPLKQSVTPKVFPAPKSLPSFSEFGLSTQDAESFFDDDDEDDGMASGSPLITV
jgi:hypothetical protein